MVIFSGLEAVGKSTLAKAFAEFRGYPLMPENFPDYTIEYLRGLGYKPKSYRHAYKLLMKHHLFPYCEYFYGLELLRLLRSNPLGVFDRGVLDVIFYLLETGFTHAEELVLDLAGRFQLWVNSNPAVLHVYVPFNEEIWRKSRKAPHRRKDLAKLTVEQMREREKKFLKLYEWFRIPFHIVQGETLDERVQFVAELDRKAS